MALQTCGATVTTGRSSAACLGGPSRLLRRDVLVIDELSLGADSILSQARRIALPRALYRLEVAATVFIAAMMIGLSLLNIAWPSALWWVWLLFGLAGAAVIVLLSLRDQAFMLPIIASVFYDRLDSRKFHLLDVRDDLNEGLMYHKLLFDEIAHQRKALLGPIVVDVDLLLIEMFRVARSVDQFVADDHVRNYLQSLTPKATGGATDTINAYAAAVLDSGEPNGDARARVEVEVEDDAVTSESEPRRELLRRVYVNLTQARADMQDAIKRLVVAHGKVAGITRADDDFSFISGVRDELSQQARRLQRRREATDALRRHCEVAAAVHAA